MHFIQKTFRLKSFKRGFHLITKDIKNEIPELSNVSIGILHVFLHHTTASLTINENTDPTVREDFESHMNIMIPENAAYYKHQSEEPDNMPGHIKSSVMGVNLTIPVTNGKLNLGTWQGVYLCEHRNRAMTRKITLTLIGQ
ncbi:MAG TPA: secondary thiamine-phosphate synthase [Cytophagales bacterium]|nr:secondary thiamine-phosphate synthase [Cytophagales bacterium]